MNTFNYNKNNNIYNTITKFRNLRPKNLGPDA